jgi:hypothetical protein
MVHKITSLQEFIILLTVNHSKGVTMIQNLAVNHLFSILNTNGIKEMVLFKRVPKVVTGDYPKDCLVTNNTKDDLFLKIWKIKQSFI